MASQQKLSTKSAPEQRHSVRLGPSGAGSERLAHLCRMDTTTPPQRRSHAASDQLLDPVVTMSQLAAQLGVTVQTLYDLRSQGRGPRGFRVGRELRFRVSAIAAWLAGMEDDDAQRHPQQDPQGVR